MTNLGALHVHRECLHICNCQWRSLSAATPHTSAFPILTIACANRQCPMGRRGRRPLQRPTGSLVLTFHFPFPAFSPLFLECLLTKSDFCAIMRPSNEVRWQQCSLQQNECLAPGQKNWPGVLPCAEHAVSEEPHSMTVSLTGSCFQPRLFLLPKYRRTERSRPYDLKESQRRHPHELSF